MAGNDPKRSFDNGHVMMLRRLIFLFVAAIVFVAAAHSASSKEDSCHIALNNLWFKVVASGAEESDSEKSLNHNLIRSLLASCEDATPYFNYDDAPGAPTGPHSIIFFAVYLDDLELFQRYLSQGHPIDGLPTPMPYTTLQAAAHGSSPMILKWLLDQGLDPDFSPDGLGETALMIAATRDQSELNSIELLVNAGADINATDQDGASPLVYAMRSRQKSNLPILVEHGADVSQARDYFKGWLGDPRIESIEQFVSEQLAILATLE